MSHKTTLAWDIGGANLKAVHGAGQVVHQSFALWKQPDRLADEMVRLAQAMPSATCWRLTMTGELCDCFADKRAGVTHILQSAQAAAKRLQVDEPSVWTTQSGLRPLSSVDADAWPWIAGANWHALASALAERYPQQRGLLIDSGSTTTDVLLLRHGQVACRGLNDPQRLASGELVYIGLRRTPLMGIASRLSAGGVTYRLMNEHFATMDDVALLKGLVAEDARDGDTADGQPRTCSAARRRILRMIGGDQRMFDDRVSDALAQGFWQAAVDHLAAAIRQVVGDSPIDRVILSGSGEVLAQAAMEAAMGNSPVVADRLSAILGPSVSSVACAWALLQPDAC